MSKRQSSVQLELKSRQRLDGWQSDGENSYMPGEQHLMADLLALHKAHADLVCNGPRSMD